MLSKQELSIGFQRIYNSAQEAEEQVEKIFYKCDIDGSGNIDYSEWVVATIDKKRLLTTEKLQSAFKLFDKDGSGTISAQEVKELICTGQNIDDEQWDKVAHEIELVDHNGNGELEFEEFCTMMQKMLSDEEEYF